MNNMKSDLATMLEEIRSIISRYGYLPDKEVYDALTTEAEGWDMRLQELENANDE